MNDLILVVLVTNKANRSTKSPIKKKLERAVLKLAEQVNEKRKPAGKKKKIFDSDDDDERDVSHDSMLPVKSNSLKDLKVVSAKKVVSKGRGPSKMPGKNKIQVNKKNGKRNKPDSDDDDDSEYSQSDDESDDDSDDDDDDDASEGSVVRKPLKGAKNRKPVTDTESGMMTCDGMYLLTG